MPVPAGAADMEHPAIPVGEFSEKVALLKANDDEGLEDDYSVREGGTAGGREDCVYMSD